jgi:hypothetical protein
MIWSCILGGLAIGLSWIVALIHLWVGNLPIEKKLIWTVFLLIFSVIAAICYYFIEVRSSHKP